MSTTRYDFDGNADGYFDDPFMKVREKGKFVLHSDYAALESKYNALEAQLESAKAAIKDAESAHRIDREAYVSENIRIEARHNALVEAVAKYCDEVDKIDNEYPSTIAELDVYQSARAEVDRLLQEA